MKKIPIILDGDPGHDDALAWTVANASDLLEIRGITTTGGNQTIEKTTYNALRIIELLKIDTNIAKGSCKPLTSIPMVAPSVHGESGLDGPDLPNPTKEALTIPAADFMRNIILSSKEKITLVPTGPLTNIATLLMTYPEVKENIEQISLMGGGIGLGNWTPAAEFNILVDPEAAKIVFDSGVPIIMSGLDVTEKSYLVEDDFQKIREVGNPVAEVMAGWLDFFYEFHKEMGHPGAPVHDAVAVAALIKPEIFTSKNLYVDIELTGEHSRGATVADYYGVLAKKPNAKVLLGVKREEFVNVLIDTAKYYGGAK